MIWGALSGAGAWPYWNKDYWFFASSSISSAAAVSLYELDDDNNHIFHNSISVHCDATDVYTFSHYDISFPTMVGLFLLSHKHIIISENIFFITWAVGDIAAGLMALLLPVVMLKWKRERGLANYI